MTDKKGGDFLTIDGEKYRSLTKSAEYLGIDRKTFRRRVLPHVKPVMLPNYAYPHFKESELDKFKPS